MDAHIVYAADLRHPIEVPASEQRHLNAWLSRRVQQPLAAPDLSGAGFSLMGGRLLADGGKPAALFMYESADGRRLTVVLAQNGQHAPGRPELLARDDLTAMTFGNGPLAVAVTGAVGSEGRPLVMALMPSQDAARAGREVDRGEDAARGLGG